MRTAILDPLSSTLIPKVLELDELCFGGLWNESGYRREIESPNSDLIAVTYTPSNSNVLEEVVSAEISDSLAASSSLEDVPRFSKDTRYILGIACAWAIVDEAHLTLLAVHPTARRQGFGRLLMWATLYHAHYRGMKRATLEVRSSNTGAFSLYTRFGFDVAGSRKKYYKDTGEDALILWRGGLQHPNFPPMLDQWNLESREILSKHGWQVNYAIALQASSPQQHHQ